MPKVSFYKTELPNIQLPGEVPHIPTAVFHNRQRKLEQAQTQAGLDCLAIYADREHAANLGWLTDFTPRFEEALWVQITGQKPMLLAGNECLSYAKTVCKLEADFELYQPFSLPGQERSQSTDLAALLKKAGLGKGMKVGLIGWKPMEGLDVPHWAVQAFQQVSGLEPVNAAHLLMNPSNGLRTALEPEQIRFAEYASALSSEGIKNWVLGLHEGQSEREAARHFESYGLELSCHPMVNFGASIPSGLGNARNAKAELGYYAQGAFGLIGGLTCRAGRLVKADYVDDSDAYLDLVVSYLETVRAWYREIKIFSPAAKAVEAVVNTKHDTWNPALNPGHLIAMDEWVHSPFTAGSEVVLRSGMAIQQDIIPIPVQGNAAINMEDGFVLADGALQAELKRLDPALMKRIAARRQWMEALGYEISEGLLPLSNIAGAYFPFMLEPGYVARFS